MASSRFATALVVIALVLTACGGSDDGAASAITRVLLPPIEAESPGTTTTTTLPMSPADADRFARTQVSSVLAAARQLYEADGTYDAPLRQVADLAPGVAVISLEEAALSEGVVYDAHDQRLTLHRRSSSGRWFCVDVTDQGSDYGFGDDFEAALEACTDGVLTDGWEGSFSPTGPDESAVKAVLGLLVDALASGDSQAAHAMFAPAPSCSPADLQTVWPPGLALVDAADFELEAVTVTGERATASVSLGPFTDSPWQLTKDGAEWQHTANPCDLIGPVAGSLMDSGAQDLLERGLFAVRSAFVLQSDFAFSPAVLADADGDLLLVSSDEVEFGTLSYTGRPSEGLLVTAGSPGRFYCAVESLSATTVFGEGETIEEVDSVRRCRAQA